MNRLRAGSRRRPGQCYSDGFQLSREVPLPVTYRTPTEEYQSSQPVPPVAAHDPPHLAASFRTDFNITRQIRREVGFRGSQVSRRYREKGNSMHGGRKAADVGCWRREYRSIEV